MARNPAANEAERLRTAELASGLGALTLGLGLGVLAADALAGWGIALLALGGTVHGFGMVTKHRIERRAGAAEVWWEPYAYWLCWILLAAGALAVAARLLRWL